MTGTTTAATIIQRRFYDYDHHNDFFFFKKMKEKENNKLLNTHTHTNAEHRYKDGKNDSSLYRLSACTVYTNNKSKMSCCCLVFVNSVRYFYFVRTIRITICLKWCYHVLMLTVCLSFSCMWVSMYECVLNRLLFYFYVNKG